VADPGGGALAPFHLAFETGVRLHRGLYLSLLLRAQLVTGANARTRDPHAIGGTSSASGAVAALLRARYMFLEARRVHPFVHADLGGGTIRYAVDLSRANDTRPLVDQYSAAAYNSGDHSVMQTVCPTSRLGCSDTVNLGYLFAGAGVGVWVDLPHHLFFTQEVTLLGAFAGLSSGQPGLSADFQLGIGAQF
jgi:hypothetical protein